MNMKKTIITMMLALVAMAGCIDKGGYSMT